MIEPSKEFTCVGTVEGTIKGEYEHSQHIDNYSSNIQSICSSLNNITDIMCLWFSKIEKNQQINHNYLEVVITSIETKIDHLGTILNIDLKNEIKTKIENVTAQINKTYV